MVPDPPEFTATEITLAAKRMKNGKAPGPDAVPVEVVRALVEVEPRYLLGVMKRLLARQEFPKEWKTAKVVFLQKSGKQIDHSTSLRPICVLNAVVKLYEHLIRGRLELEVKERGGFAPGQYGFRKGMSTIMAIQKVLEIAWETRKTPGTRRKKMVRVSYSRRKERFQFRIVGSYHGRTEEEGSL